MIEDQFLAGVRVGDAFIKARLLPEASCPFCKTTLAACSSLSSDLAGTIPTIGKLTVCVSCGTLLEFAEVGYRLADATRLAELSPDSVFIIEGTIEKSIRTGP